MYINGRVVSVSVRVNLDIIIDVADSIVIGFRD